LECCFTDTTGSFVSEASVYRPLMGRGLIASPAFILMKAAGPRVPITSSEKRLEIWQPASLLLR
jgi:hypothetical protein